MSGAANIETRLLPVRRKHIVLPRGDAPGSVALPSSENFVELLLTVCCSPPFYETRR